MTQTPSDWTTRLVDQLRGHRRLAGRKSLEAFARLYLHSHFVLPSSLMHSELFWLLPQASTNRDARIAIAAPRGHAKSTVVSLAYVLWSICYKVEPFIVLISNTAEQAAEYLATVKHELEANPKVLADFPEAAERPGARPQPERWRRAEIITRNGVRVMALGSGQKIRGRKHHQDRPTLIILDDVENETDVQSPDVRETRLNWFNKAVMKAGATTRTNVLVIGTIVHYDSLLARLVRDPTGGEAIPGWHGIKYQAVVSWSARLELWEHWAAIYSYREEYAEHGGAASARLYFEVNREAMLEGTEVLWPEREDYYALMEIRLRDGEASFDSEKQNEPVDPKSCFFDPSRIHYWDDQYRSVDELLADLGSSSSIYGACDPSLGKEGRSRDNTAIVTVLKHRPTGILYVLDADIRKRKPLEIIQAILEYQRVRRFRDFGMESNQYQAFLASELKRTAHQQGIRLPVHEIHHSSDKLGRIQSLEPLVTGGFLRFSRSHRQLLEELRQFPKGAHDDGPDALEMAVAATRRARPHFMVLEGRI